ncbi:MAG: helix-turn-helix domain-containing protein [bacterium]
MNQNDYNRYINILELSDNASQAEIHNAYLSLKKLYSSTESIAILPVLDELPPENKQEILQQIEEAYRNLSSTVLTDRQIAEDEPTKNLQPKKADPVSISDDKEQVCRSEKKPLALDQETKQLIAEIKSFTGADLQNIRQRLKIDLCEIANSTRISIHHLENIERERYETLPPSAYIRGFIVNFANYLRLDSKKVADDYMQRYKVWKEKI